MVDTGITIDTEPRREGAGADVTGEPGSRRDRAPITFPLTLRDVRVPGAAWLAAVMAVVAAGSMLYADRQLDFLGDEWTIVMETIGPPPAALLVPHNEHLILVVRAVFDMLLGTVGLTSYWPYLAALLVAHAAAGFALFAVLRHRAGDVVALAFAAVFLALGSGAEDLTWAFQVGFVAPIATGLLAVLLLDVPAAGRARLAIVTGLLTITVMFSTVGVVLCAAVAVELLMDRSRRSLLAVLALPAVLYALWFLVLGRHGLSRTLSPFSGPALTGLVPYVPLGLSAAIAALFGAPATWSSLVPYVVMPLLVLHWYRQDWPTRARIAGPFAAAVVLFISAGFVRDQLGAEQAQSSRYVYVAAPLLLLAFAPGVARLRWRSAWPPVLAILVVVSIVLNGLAMQQFLLFRQGQVAAANAQMRTVAAFRGAPDMDLDAPLGPFIVPLSARQYYTAVQRYGSPVPSTTPAELRSLPPDAVDDTMRALFRRGIRIRPAGGGDLAAACPSSGSSGSRQLELGNATSLLVVPTQPGKVRVSLGYLGQPRDQPTAEFDVTGPVRITLPDTGIALRWQVRVEAPSASRICPA